MKILYQETFSPSETIRLRNTSYEELKLPTDIMRQLYENLFSSTEILPESARKLQEWHVGLLERFDPPADDQRLPPPPVQSQTLIEAMKNRDIATSSSTLGSYGLSSGPDNMTDREQVLRNSGLMD